MKRFFTFLDELLQRYTPDPFVIAIYLTVVTLLFGWLCFDPSVAPESVAGWPDSDAVFQLWGTGFMGLAQFTLQMAMILIGGYVVATSPPVSRLLSAMVSRIRTPVQAVLFCTLASLFAAWINWGFGLVVGGVVALKVGKSLPSVPFRVLVASSYSGFLVWHGGLSGSIPLALNSVSDPSHVLVGDTIPVSQTLFSPLNLTAVASLAVLLPLLNLLFLRFSSNVDDLSKEFPEPRTMQSGEGIVWFDRSILPMLVFAGLAVCYWQAAWRHRAFSLNLDSTIFMFFVFGFVLHGNPERFIRAVTNATPKIAPILVQYPLYAGIKAVLIHSGLADRISGQFVEWSNDWTFSLMTFYSAGLLNLLIPSGGGQWTVQAPIVIPAARELGVDISKAAMAVAWGDAWTNMAQPFWAVPLLSIAGLQIRDIIGYCLLILLASGTVLSLIFLFM